MLLLFKKANVLKIHRSLLSERKKAPPWELNKPELKAYLPILEAV